MLVLTWVLRYFSKRGNIRKRVCWNRRLRLLFFTLCIRVSRNFYLHLCFKLRYYIQNGAKFLQKLTPGFKNPMRNLDNIRQAVESPKKWNLMGYFCPKNTLLQREHYLPKIYLTLLSTTCMKIHQITYVIFETIHNSFFTTQFLCIFFAQTLHTFYKRRPSKCKFSDFLLFGLCHFSNKKSVFLQSLDLFSVSWEIILLYFFCWNFICYWEK